MGLKLILKFYFDHGPEQKLEDTTISSWQIIICQRNVYWCRESMAAASVLIRPSSISALEETL